MGSGSEAGSYLRLISHLTVSGNWQVPALALWAVGSAVVELAAFVTLKVYSSLLYYSQA